MTILQTHLSPSSWNGLLEPPVRLGMSYDKPPAAFWTSTLLEDGTSGWERWCESEMPSKLGDIRFHFEVIGTPRLLVFRNNLDFFRAFVKAGVLKGDCLGDPDDVLADRQRRADFWEWVASAYDGIHVPDDYDMLSVVMRFDCECTAWFRPQDHLRLVGTDPRMGNAASLAVRR